MSGCSEQRLPSSCRAMASHCSAFSGCRTWALEHASFSSFLGALLPPGMWNLLGPGIEPVFPALVGRFFTTGPPGMFPVPFYSRMIFKTYRSLICSADNTWKYIHVFQLTFEHIKLKVICDDVSNLDGYCNLSFCLSVTSHSNGKVPGFHHCHV